MKRNTIFQSIWKWVDRYLGRGSYLWIRPWLAPYQEDTHLTYAKTLSQLARPGIRWLDAGCGHKVLQGSLEQDENKIVQRTRLAVGCDAFATSLERHRSFQNIVSCDLSSLPFGDASFDLVTLNMVAEHLREPARTFSELARVLDRDGQLVIHTPCSSSYEIWMIRLGWRLLPKRLGYWMIRFREGREPGDVFPTFYRANTRRRLSKLMSEAGLVEEELRVIEGCPFFYFAAPLSILEILVEWFLRAIGKNEVCPATFLGVYRRAKSPAPGAETLQPPIPAAKISPMPIRQELLDILVCPACKKHVQLTPQATDVGCASCHCFYPILHGVPNMLDRAPDAAPK